ncbi:translation initiation factor Sui1 [Marinobacter qingdaonensis]|jgi:translation initiation factor 1|uniref:Translation initiation factor Sui1 n=1 Tax=Marinobacter qingdaonensis TaxID=3108486 RepID=A0ABU5NZJ1_9GAMM|nr:translation initiation factor Sui1 [Marinobacter sp. ASW11-75]MEA1081223.1 translation initiation factor Sui1 [Marinobacter sp. ASW11-75]MEE2763477.1 translation initiation factor Sui1 [Pseudomonadota bacterium]MEE3117538.1 translation initiation factor Sui1 [Pseudomonadota bacterium]
MAKRSAGGLVFSTEQGRMCPGCRQPVADCICGQPARPEGDGIVRVSRETKGRKGKGVTLVTGIPLDDKELKAFAKVLKAKCGTGGTVKDGVVEIQGDQRDLLVPLLEAKGWTVKRSGG